MQMTRIGRYTVRRDSIIDGVRVWVVQAQVTSRMDATGAGPAPGVRMRSTLDGEEQGEFYFAADAGRLVGRRRSGELVGYLEFTGGPQPVRMPQRVRYDNTLQLLR